MDAPAIETHRLGKVYRNKVGDVAAVEDLNLTVQAGEIFGLLGPNGAGKTTTVRMLCGLLRPTSGSVRVDGISMAEDPGEARSRFGLVPEDAGDHKNLTLQEELAYYGSLYGLDPGAVEQRSMPLIERLGLEDRVRHRLNTFSRGMRRKFHLIRALLHQPRILLLDEPTAGLDPAVVEEVWNLLKTLAAERGVTVILCSHHLEEVERLCTRIAIMRKRMLVEGTMAELGGGERRYRVEVAGDGGAAAEHLRNARGIVNLAVAGRVIRFEVGGDAQSVVPSLVRGLVESGADVLEFAREGRDLRSLYRSAIGEHEGGRP